MKRPSLAFGLVTFTMALLFLFFRNSALVVVCPFAVAAILFYTLSKNEKIRKLLIIPTISISILISSLAFLLNNQLVYEKSIKYENTTHDIVATIIEKHPEYYIIRTSLIGSNEEKIKILFVPEEDTTYEIYDNIFIDDAVITESRYDSDKAEKCIVSVYNSEQSEKINTHKKDFYFIAINFRELCKSKLFNFLSGDSYGIASGMLFGDTESISDEVKADFRSSGVAHLLAVSGLHTSLWCGLFITFLKFLKLKEKYANLFGIFILVVLSVISGFTPSVIRASFMMGITLIAPIFKKRSDSINSLGFALAVILLVNPYVLYTPSFFLSFSATLGVILSSGFSLKFNFIYDKLKTHQLTKRILKFVFESLLISIFATIFTLPASVYYFGTVSIIAPLTNLLTINLAFITMVATLISLSASFIPFQFFSSLTEIFFAITNTLLNILLKIISFVGSVKFSAITANDTFVYFGIAFAILLFVVYYVLSLKLPSKVIYKRLLNFLIPLPVILSLILSVTPFKGNTSFTVLRNTNTPNIVIRTGTHYAVINIPENLNYEDYRYLPMTNADTFDLLAVTHIDGLTLQKADYINKNYKINRRIITSFCHNSLYKYETDAFELAQVSDEYFYSLENEINVRIFNTYGKNCAIIEFNEKIIVLSFSEYNNLHKIKQEFGGIDVLVLSENVPDNFNVEVGTLIICSMPYNNFHKNDKIGYLYSSEFLRTSASGNIEIKF